MSLRDVFLAAPLKGKDRPDSCDGLKLDAKGNISVKTDSVRQALDYYKKLAQYLPPDAPAHNNSLAGWPYNGSITAGIGHEAEP